MRTHRVGTLTLGIMLLVSGTLFLLRILIQNISYEFIFKLWPFVFIFLGIELLYANLKHSGEKTKLVYDKTAFFLIIILSFFAVGMAIAELCVSYASSNLTFYISY